MAPSRFSDKLKALFGIRSGGGDEVFDDLADLLVEADLRPSDAFAVAEELRAACRKEGLRDAERIEERLASLLAADLRAADGGLEPGRLNIVLLLGVNGVGKTTTAAKLTSLYLRAGAVPVLAAADTFRAAAIDQLKIHGERLGARVVAHKHGGDPAAVVYDAIEAASARGADVIVADTAGRMHTKSALVEELKKIDRVVASKAPEAAYRKFLVLDATTGGNAYAQAETFREAVGLDGAVLTKYDSGAKGGVAVSLARGLSLPVAFVCTGEGYSDIRAFDPDAYARALVGLA